MLRTVPYLKTRLAERLGSYEALSLLVGIVPRLVVGHWSHRVSAFWTRTGTWGIASSHEPAGGRAASCLMATAYPAVVPALLSSINFDCGSNKNKISDLVILIFYL